MAPSETQSVKKREGESMAAVVYGEDEERWVKHYSSNHEILLVGDGDFSFSLSLALAFHSASNIVATSLDSQNTVVSKYANAKSNLEALETMGATILHGVDATKMKLHSDLKMWKFDRIIYNFPHAGFKGKEDQIQLIKLHRQLVYDFFRNAQHMLRPFGEVHVTHKTESPYNKWNLEELASENSLVLIESAAFNITDYPGYNNKRGDGVNCDEPFRLGECCTYKFAIGGMHGKKASQKMKAAISHMNVVNVTSEDGSWCAPEINHSSEDGSWYAPEINHSSEDGWYASEINHSSEDGSWYAPEINHSSEDGWYASEINHSSEDGLWCAPEINHSSEDGWYASEINHSSEDGLWYASEINHSFDIRYRQADFMRKMAVGTQNTFVEPFNAEHIPSTAVKATSRWISGVPQTNFYTPVVGIQRKINSPPWYGNNNLSSRALANHVAELRETVRIFDPDFRHPERYMSQGWE